MKKQRVMANEQNLKPYQPGESGNPNGRPPKTLTWLNKELTGQGYERVKAAEAMEAMELLLGLDAEKLTELVHNAEQPILVRTLAKRLLGNQAHDLIEKMLDRVHGKAKQRMEHTGEDGAVLFPPWLPK